MPYRIVGIGEVLWDLLPTGAQLGGAPANFACHAGALGADASVISRVGDDARGHEIVRRIEAMGMTSACVQLDTTRPTGTVTVTVDATGQPQPHVPCAVPTQFASGRWHNDQRLLARPSRRSLRRLRHRR
jgi:hypothetical protein